MCPPAFGESHSCTLSESAGGGHYENVPSFIGVTVEVPEREPTMEEKDAWLQEHDIFEPNATEEERSRTYAVFHKVRLGDLAWAHPRKYFKELLPL